MNGNTSPYSGDRDRLEQLWSAALSLPEPKRREFVAAIDDDTLRAELESLLAQVEPAEAFFAGLDAIVQQVHEAAADADALESGDRDGAGGVLGQRVSDPLIGGRVGHYHIQGRLGEGGMGVVYRALDTRLQRTVALKFLPARLNSDPGAAARFLNEARAAAALDHPNICNVHEIGAAGGLPFIAMAFYSGRTLGQVLDDGALPLPQALDYALQIARGLSAAHDRGVIHRDVKPGNVVITADGVVKLLDFGIARVPDVSVTHPGLSPGTIVYMSPEQLTARPIDQRTDFWSLGIILYEMCTGVRPFRTAEPGAILHSILYDEPRNPATNGRHVPPHVHAIIQRLLEKDPRDRYGSAEELVAELMACLEPVAAGGARARTGRRRVRFRPRAYAVASAIGAAMLALLLAAQRAERVRILVADAAGDSLFGGTVSERLRHGLASPGVTVIGRASLEDVLARMGREPSVRLSPDIAREIAVREGMKVFVQVTVDRIGSALLIGAALVAAESGDIMQYHQASAVNAAELPAAIDRVANAMRTTLGRSRVAIRDTTALLAVTTDSTSALRRHLQAVQANRSGDFLRGIQLLHETLAIDSAFAEAHQASGFTHEQIGQRAGRAQLAVTRAYQLRGRLTAHERHLIEADHYWHVDGNLSSAIRSLRSAHAAIEAVQPGRVLNRRSYGLALMLNGDFVEADSVMQEARRFAPCPATTTHLVNVLHALDRPGEAHEVLRAAVDQWPTNPFLRMDQAHFLAAAGKYRAAHDEVERRLHRGFTLPFALRAEAVFDAVEGRVNEAIGHLRHLQQYQLEAALAAPALEVSAAIGRLHLAAGDAFGARREVEEFLQHHPLSSLDAAERPYLSLALFFATAGDPQRARQLSSDYDSLAPVQFKGPDRWMQHRVRAAVLMAVDSPAAALRELQQAQSSDRIWSEWLDNLFFTMDERPELARVYDRLGQPDSAIAVYERYLNARVLYRAEMDAFHLADVLLRLGQLHDAANRAGDAAAYYERLSSLRKNADARLTSLSRSDQVRASERQEVPRRRRQ